MQVRWRQRCKCVGMRGERTWESAPTARKHTADARIIIASNLSLFLSSISLTSLYKCVRAPAARLPPPTTTPFLTPAYQLASLAALGTPALARLRRASHLSLSLVSAHACGARTHLRALTPLLCQLASHARCLGHSRVGAPAARIVPFSFSFSLSFPSPFPFSFPYK